MGRRALGSRLGPWGQAVRWPPLLPCLQRGRLGQQGRRGQWGPEAPVFQLAQRAREAPRVQLSPAIHWPRSAPQDQCFQRPLQAPMTQWPPCPRHYLFHLQGLRAPQTPLLPGCPGYRGSRADPLGQDPPQHLGAPETLTDRWAPPARQALAAQEDPEGHWALSLQAAQSVHLIPWALPARSDRWGR